jgi:hypothetical protein
MEPKKRKKATESKSQSCQQRTNPSIDANKIATNEDVASVLRTLRIISKYPIKPAQLFAKTCAEISTAKMGSQVLRSLFSGSTSQTHIPKELCDLCVAYYVDEKDAFVKRMLGQFQFFADRTVITRTLKQCPSRLKSQLTLLIDALDCRGPAYLWWFLMRSSLLSFIPLGDVSMRRENGNPCLWDAQGHKIASVSFHDGGLSMGVPHYDGYKWRFSWCSSIERIVVPYPDLIAPCLNTSTVSLERLNACAVELEDRTRENDGTWLPRLFDLFKSLTAIKLWICDMHTFEFEFDSGNKELAQALSCLHWNEFHAQFQFGEPFRVRKDKEASSGVAIDEVLIGWRWVGKPIDMSYQLAFFPKIVPQSFQA